MGELAHLTVERGVGTITLDSPENRNAMSERVMADLYRHLDTALADDAVRVVVLTATGPIFCAGADLKAMRAGGAVPGPARPAAPSRSIYDELLASPKPVVGRINGGARAGGAGLVACCDIAVGVEDATFGFSEVRIGVVPALLAALVLPKIGLAHGTELLLTGDLFDGRRAAEIGLLTQAVPAGGLDEAVDGYVDSLRKGAPGALARTKEALRALPAVPPDRRLAWAGEFSAGMFATEEALEGMAAFAEKRPPRWAAD